MDRKAERKNSSMDDVKHRIKELLDEIIQVRLWQAWPERLNTMGVEADEARTWGAEISQVVDEYRSTLMSLADLLDETDPEQIRTKVHSWAIGISEVTVPEIQEPMKYLASKIEGRLPAEEKEEMD